MKTVLRTALFLLTVFASAAAAGQQSLVTEDKFTALYLEALRVQAPDLDVRVAGPMELSIGTDEGDITAYLDNAYARYRTAPDMLVEIIDDYVLATVDTARAQDTGTDVTRIVPVIKGADYLAELQRGTVGDRALEVAHERYNDHLVILYAEDTPRNIRYLSDEDLDELGVDRAGLRETAVSNLDRLLPEMLAQGSDGTYMLIADGNYEASLLLFDDIWTGDIWRNGSLPVIGDLVIAVPSRDLLLVTGSLDKGGLALLREIADQTVAEDPYSLTSQLFIYRDGRFQPFNS